MVAWHCEMFTGRSGDTTIVASCMVTVWSLNTTINAPRMSTVKKTACLVSPRWKPCCREVREDELFNWRCLMQERLVYNSLRPFVHLETRRGLKPKCVPQLYLDRYWGHAGQLLANFYLSLTTSQRSLRKLTRPSLLPVSHVANWLNTSEAVCQRPKLQPNPKWEELVSEESKPTRVPVWN